MGEIPILEDGTPLRAGRNPGAAEDTTITDIAEAAGCGPTEIGIASRTDRGAVYNQRLRIEEPGPAATYGTGLWAG